MTADDARRIALTFPEAVEQDHHGRPSFRVGGRIFATVWTPEALNVMAPEGVIRAAVAEDPERCAPVMWGRKLSAVQVALADADPDRVEDLLHAAWSLRAPKRLREG
jgi:hypothetical protein